jgi:hypothetical protein
LQERFIIYPFKILTQIFILPSFTPAHVQFEQFARTVGDAAVDQQRQKRQSQIGFANVVSTAAQQANATWPLFRVPNFELLAGQVALQSGSEFIACTILVDAADESKYLKFVNDTFEDSIHEGHMIRYGNLDRIVPIGYTSNFTVVGPNGFQPDTAQQPFRSPLWQLSPRTYDFLLVIAIPLHFNLFVSNDIFLLRFRFKITALATFFNINFDVASRNGDILSLINAMLTLKNESVTSAVAPYLDSGILTKEEHEAMHSKLPQSNVSFPHSFSFTPIHKTPGDYNSKVVAYIADGFAWDFALRYLLPDNIEGIVVDIRNTCNQSSTYELMGYDAFYLGENVAPETKYEGMAVVRDLSLSTNMNSIRIPGHCLYTIVRT